MTIPVVVNGQTGEIMPDGEPSKLQATPGATLGETLAAAEAAQRNEQSRLLAAFGA